MAFRFFNHRYHSQQTVVFGTEVVRRLDDALLKPIYAWNLMIM